MGIQIGDKLIILIALAQICTTALLSHHGRNLSYIIILKNLFFLYNSSWGEYKSDNHGLQRSLFLYV